MQLVLVYIEKKNAEYNYVISVEVLSFVFPFLYPCFALSKLSPQSRTFAVQ